MVCVGCTSGYTGEYIVATGVVMIGLSVAVGAIKTFIAKWATPIVQVAQDQYDPENRQLTPVTLLRACVRRAGWLGLRLL